MNTRLYTVTALVLFALSEFIYAQNPTRIIDREEMTVRAHQSWEGPYVFSDEQIVSIEGQTDLHILIYRKRGNEGTLVDFASAASEGSLRLLREADTNLKGVVPVLEGIDVLPGANEAEILVRWRHPGQGGLRSVHKYRYNSEGLELVARSDLVRVDRKMKWVVVEPAERSTPARLAPSSESAR
ncbi:MAG: hypothetical protein ACOX5G_04190 [Kiritimatiellia bacterium]|jgi:hypothetical protein